MKSVLNQNFKSLSSTLLAGLLLVGVASVSNVTLTTEANAESPTLRPAYLNAAPAILEQNRIRRLREKGLLNAAKSVTPSFSGWARPAATPTPTRPARPASTRPARNPREFCLEFGAINFCHRK